MRLRIFLWLWLLCLSPAWAVQTQVLSRAYLVDPQGKLDFPQVRQQLFTPLPGILARGYTPTVTWLRITVQNATPGEPLVLRIRPGYLDEVRLYAQDAQGRWQQQVAGDRYPYVKRSYPGITPCFLVRQAQAQAVYYLRLHTTSTSMLSVEAQPLQQALQFDVRQSAWQIPYYAILLWLLVWAIADYRESRDRVVGLFIPYQLLSVFINLAFMGYYSMLAPASYPQLADVATSWTSTLFCLASLMFHRHLLLGFSPPWLLQWVLKLLPCYFPLLFLLLAFGMVQPVMQTNTMMAPVQVLLMAMTAWLVPPHPLRRLLRVLYTLSIAVVALTMLPLLGIGNVLEMNQYGQLMQSLLISALAFVLLQRRSTQLRSERHVFAVELELAQQQIAIERQQSEEQSRFMAMLTHELKTPMSVISMALGSLRMQLGEQRILLHAERAVDDMNAVVERCTQADRIEQGQLDILRETIVLAELVQDVCSNSREPERVVLHPGTVPLLHSDSQLLRTVLSNLIDNAMKYSPAASVINVKWGVKSAGLWLSVDNVASSAGMPDASKVFTKYYRSPGAHSKTGSGLGLYLVRGLCTQLQGMVSYRPEANIVRFEVWLPVSTR
ncbi:sensor histidine kinase [Vogesella mureinivorans]|uniref:sensor histidine kinase n=1 Tax=Vogesella mureinivorans TaxID=657276 RepID=UPI0011CC9003|nr:7TM-DISM domain-containing protein [Vogesella mureinivorans]